MRRWRMKAAMLAVVTMVTTLLSVAPTTDAPRAEAAVASNFSPGNIISDAQFFDGDAMNAPQVQAFLDGQLQRCATGYTCLKDYQQATPLMPSNLYCDAIPARGSATSSQIIVDVARACDVSPRVLLVLLQKEQSLVTHPSPSRIRYERATGFACPDTAPCDSSFGGFYYQVYYAARQFQRYAAHPRSYSHRAGETNRVWWHPNQACGSSSVFIENQATAGLYNYTPYRPNSAALANLYGSGDSCSAYGNRNFWRMWTDWFGDPRSEPESGAFLRNRTNGKTYLISGSTRHHIPTPAIFNEYASRLGDVRDVEPAALDRYAEGPMLTRTVLGSDGALLLVDNGVAHRFASCALAEQFRFSCSGQAKLDASLQARLGVGDAMAATVQDSSGHAWLIQNGARRELADVTIPTRYGYSGARVSVDRETIEHLRVGAPVIDSGTAVRNAAGTIVRIKSGSSIVPLSAAQISTLPSSTGVVFTEASLQQLAATTGDLPTRVRSASGAYLVTDAGLLRVDAARYGGTATFTARNDLVHIQQALPSAGATSLPHFVQEAGAAELYLASGSRLQPVADRAAYDFIRSRFGVPARIWIVPAGGLSGVPTVLDVSVGDLVRGSDGRVHLWDGARAMPVQNLGYTTALGISPTVRTVSDQVMGRLAKGPAISDFGFRCGATDSVAIDGSLRPFASAAAKTAWGLTHVQLDPALCATLTVSRSAVTQFINDPAGRTYLMQDAQRRYITSPAVFAELGGWSVGRVQLSAVAMELVPKGSSIVTLIDPGTWVRGSDGRVYLWDGSRAMHLWHPRFATALGIELDVQSMSDATIASLAKGPSIGNLGFRCGSTDYVAYDGALHPFKSAAAATAWGLPHVPLSAALCGELTVSPTAVTQFVYGPAGRTYLVDGGRLRYISSPAAFAQLGGWTVGRTLLPSDIIASLPKGPAI